MSAEMRMQHVEPGQAQDRHLATAWSGTIGHVLYGNGRNTQLEPFLEDGCAGDVGKKLKALDVSSDETGFLVSGMWFTPGRKSLLVHVIGRQTGHSEQFGVTVEYWVTWEYSEAGPVIKDVTARIAGEANA